ncbi:MAG: transglutaminase-like domain-containing protein [Dysgonomonas sp.]
MDREPFAPDSREIIPLVYIAPTDFCFDSKCGNMSDWDGYGKWVSALLEGRDALPLDFTGKLKELVKTAKSEKEKVGILYKYLQDNFRYLSIQLGIGGFQPIEAQSTLKNKFGDCKGLTYLMKAMLRVVDIESNYCEIYLGNRKEFYRDFPSITQTNHVILLVPLQNDSVWLECTSSTTPFGYVHDRIAGHDVLVITDNGGKVCQLPTYTSKQNKKESRLQINISEDGTANGSITFEEHLIGYDYAKNYYNILSNDREKVVEYINANVSMPKIQIGEINTSENKSALPSCSLILKYEAIDFASKTGTRLFIPVCPLKKSYYNIFSAAKRNLDIEIGNGFSESDTIIMQIPEMYTPESLPKDISLTTDFGTFSSQSILEGNKIIYIQNTEVFSGRYSKERYKEIKDFFGEIATAIKRKVVVKKS